MDTYTIYRSPADAPGLYVVRQWHVSADQLQAGAAWQAPTLWAARGLIPAGLHCIRRSPADDPAIVETWL